MAKIEDKREECTLAVQRARIQLARSESNGKPKYPFWTTLVQNLTVTINPKIATSAISAKGNMIVNPDWFLGLNEDERIFLLAHEACHPAFRDFSRRGNRDPKLWNDAIDYAVNNALLQDRVGKMPQPGLSDPRFFGMAREEIYDALKAETQNQPQPDQGRQGDGSAETAPPPTPQEPGKGDQPLAPSSGNFDLHSKELPPPQVDQEWRGALVAAIQTARAAGNLPHALTQDLAAETQSLVNWPELLANWANSWIRAGISWLQPNRRQEVYRPIIMPGNLSRAIEDLVVAVDTSGSMSNNEIRTALSQIGYIMMGADVKNLWCLQHDAIVHHAEQFEAGQTIPKVWQTYGRGGTKFTPVFEWIKEHGLQPPGVVMLTDTYGTWPTEEPPYPVAILTHEQLRYRRSPSWATVIYVEEWPEPQDANS